LCSIGKNQQEAYYRLRRMVPLSAVENG